MSNGQGDDGTQTGDALPAMPEPFYPCAFSDYPAPCVFRCDVFRNLPVQVFQKSNELVLSFALIGLTPNSARARVKSSKQIQCPVSLIFMFHSHRQSRLSWESGCFARTRLHRGFFINTQHHFMLLKSAGVQLTDLLNRFSKGCIPWQCPAIATDDAAKA